MCRRDPKEEARHRRIRAVKAVPGGGLDESRQGKALATMVGLGGLDATPTSPGDGRHGGGRGALEVAATGRRRRATADEVAGRRQGRRRCPGTRDSDLVEKAHGHEGKAAATSSCGGFVRQRRCSGELGDKAPRTRQEGKKRRKGIGARRCCSLCLSLAALEGEIERGEREVDRARERLGLEQGVLGLGGANGRGGRMGRPGRLARLSPILPLILFNKKH